VPEVPDATKVPEVIEGTKKHPKTASFPEDAKIIPQRPLMIRRAFFIMQFGPIGEFLSAELECRQSLYTRPEAEQTAGEGVL
jgi:hypothetical protein